MVLYRVHEHRHMCSIVAVYDMLKRVWSVSHIRQHASDVVSIEHVFCLLAILLAVQVFHHVLVMLHDTPFEAVMHVPVQMYPASV